MLDVPLNAMWKNCEQEQTRTGKNQIESYDLLQTNTIHEEGSTQTKIIKPNRKEWSTPSHLAFINFCQHAKLLSRTCSTRR
jgi:hypothetical protein